MHAFLSRILTRSANLKDQDVLEKHDNNDTKEEKKLLEWDTRYKCLDVISNLSLKAGPIW